MEAIVLSIGLSLHAGFDDIYNEIHPHIRYENESVIAGTFINSIERLSWYGGYRTELDNWGFEFTLTTGYNYKIGPAARVTYDYNDVTRVFISPGSENDNIGIVFGVELMTN